MLCCAKVPEAVGPAQAELTIGVLLLAAEATRGYWRHACILVVDHSEKLTVGLLLSKSASMRKRPFNVALRAVCELQQPPLERGIVLSGGPVGFDPHVLHTRRRLSGARNIGDGVIVGGALDALLAALEDEDETSLEADECSEETVGGDSVDERTSICRPVRAFHGCALWGARQLEKEVRRGSWCVIPRPKLDGGVLTQLVFHEPPSTIWGKAQELI